MWACVGAGRFCVDWCAWCRHAGRSAFFVYFMKDSGAHRTVSENPAARRYPARRTCAGHDVYKPRRICTKRKTRGRQKLSRGIVGAFRCAGCIGYSVCGTQSGGRVFLVYVTKAHGGCRRDAEESKTRRQPARCDRARRNACEMHPRQGTRGAVGGVGLPRAKL